MVASSSSNRSPPLSYAQRARRAQNIKSPIEVVPEPLAASTSTSSTSSATSTISLSVSSHTATPVQPAFSLPSLANGLSNSSPALDTLSSSTTTKSPTVNVWVRRKEEFAAKAASTQKDPVHQPSSSSSHTTLDSSSSRDLASNDVSTTTSDSKPNSAAQEADDDLFVVKESRVPRPLQIPITPPTDNAEDWPEVGKSVSISSITEVLKPETTTTEAAHSSSGKKSGQQKWITLPLQPPAETHQQHRRDFYRSNRQGQGGSAHPSRPSSNSGHGRNGRSHSERNSTNHSANQSRVQSNAGSLQSSPRNPRSKRLPLEEPHATITGPPSRNSRTSSPLPSTLTSSLLPNNDASHCMTYLSPPYVPSPYYPQSSALPHINSPIYRPSSIGSPLGLQPDPSLPIPPPVPGYIYMYPNTYPSYDYNPALYPYWNNNSHPNSGQHSPAYPPSATPSTPYSSALPIHMQQPFYPAQPQPQAPLPHYIPISVSGPASRKAPHMIETDASAGVPTSSSTSSADVKKVNGANTRPLPPVVFGSIDIENAPSPAPTTQIVQESTTKEGIEKAFTALAIGVTPTDAALKARNKTIKSGRSLRPGLEEKEKEKENQNHTENDLVTVDPVTVKDSVSVVGDTKWKFGNEGFELTVTGGDVVTGDIHPSVVVQNVHTGNQAQVGELPEATGPILFNRSSDGGDQNSYSTGVPPPVTGDSLDDDFQVRNFGFGFGTPATAGYTPETAGKDEVLTEKVERREGDVIVDNGRVGGENSGTQQYQGGMNGRMRRGHYGGSYNGNGFERGGYNGRRGRGMNHYGGRGFRGGSGSIRGNHNGNSFSQRQGHGQGQGQIPPYNITPPSPFLQGIPSPIGDPNANFYSPRPPLPNFIPPGYDPYAPPHLSIPHAPPPPHPPLPSQQQQQSQQQPHVGNQPNPSPTNSSGGGGGGGGGPPMPVPMSQLPFPLDSTRYYLLGQLEYYLSPQNMVQDFFLRQRMDSRGWIPIQLLASFNRVISLTLDYQLVRGVLMLSRLVQVKGDFVRMGGWERFVLPDALKSLVEGDDDVDDDSGYNGSNNLDGYIGVSASSSLPISPNSNSHTAHQVDEGHSHSHNHGGVAGMPIGLSDEPSWSLGLGSVDYGHGQEYGYEQQNHQLSHPHHLHQNYQNYQQQQQQQQDNQQYQELNQENGVVEDDDEEEEEIEIVLGDEGNKGMWSHEKRTSSG